MKTWHWVLLGVVALLVLNGGGGVQDRTQQIAEAIARAEGYYVNGSVPQRFNNPGDLKGGDGNIRRFATAADGWEALRNQIRLILDGESRYYDPTMTIFEIAQIYTGGDNANAWAHIVAEQLGVSVDSRITDIV